MTALEWVKRRSRRRSKLQGTGGKHLSFILFNRQVLFFFFFFFCVYWHVTAATDMPASRLANYRLLFVKATLATSNWLVGS